jgi:hypothetical protein
LLFFLVKRYWCCCNSTQANNHETKQKKQTKILLNQQLKNKSIYFCGATKQFWLLFKVVAIRLVTNWCQLYRKAHNISLIQHNKIPQTTVGMVRSVPTNDSFKTIYHGIPEHISQRHVSLATEMDAVSSVE